MTSSDKTILQDTNPNPDWTDLDDVEVLDRLNGHVLLYPTQFDVLPADDVTVDPAGDEKASGRIVDADVAGRRRQEPEAQLPDDVGRVPGVEPGIGGQVPDRHPRLALLVDRVDQILVRRRRLLLLRVLTMVLVVRPGMADGRHCDEQDDCHRPGEHFYRPAGLMLWAFGLTDEPARCVGCKSALRFEDVVEAMISGIAK